VERWKGGLLYLYNIIKIYIMSNSGELLKFCDNDLDLFFNTLAEKYNDVSIPNVNLNMEEESELNNITIDIENSVNKLNQNGKQQLVFNKLGFSEIVKRIYSIIKNGEQAGGIDPIVPYTKRTRLTNSDLLASLALATGLICIIIAWYKLINILSVIPVSDHFGSDVQQAFRDNLKNVPMENMNFLAYFFKVLFGMTGQVLTSQQGHIQSLLSSFISKTIMTSSGEILTNCLPQESSSILNSVSTFFTTFVSPNSYQQCILKSGEVLGNAALYNAGVKLSLVNIQIGANIAAIGDLTTFGTRLTYASIGYISYRIGLIRAPRLGNDAGLIETGGYKKRKTVRTKRTKTVKKTRRTKKSKKSKKSKKTTRVRR
jgi:hypothetical protein